MKLSTLIIFLSITYVTADEISSQTARINIDVDGKPIADVLSDIEEKTSYLFFYNKKDIDVEKLVTASFKNTSVSEILERIFTGTEVKYSLVKDYIVLTQDLPVETEFRQVQRVQGQVTDSGTGEPVIGANVIIEGTTQGVVTDLDGKFSLEIQKSNAVLVISFLGYITERVPFTGQTNIEVKMVQDIKSLEEVVVVGYGTVRKSDLTGSVSSVKSDQLSSFPVSGAVQALQGRAAGVQISSNNGDPGGSVTVKIRGGTSINASSNPLYVVDGFPGAFLPQPEDIETLEILKDASATAIYGSRGANGVIMITTKKGKKGKVSIAYNTSFSQQSETNRIDLLNSQEFLDLTTPYYPNYVSEGQNTDWQDIVLQKGKVQTHQLAVSGGAENVNYYVSGYFFDQKGLVIGSGFNKYSLTSNININANKKLTLGVNLFMQRSETDGVLTQEGSGGSTGAGVIGSALRFMPDQGIYQPDGVTYSIAKLGDPIDNPYTILKENTRNVVSDRLQAKISGEYKIIENLTFNSTLGLSSNSDRNGFYASSLTNIARGKGNAAMNAVKNSTFVAEDYFNYNSVFGGIHRLGLMAGYSYTYDRYESWGAASNAFISDAFSFWNMGGGTETPSTATSGLVDERLSSFYGRINYGLNDKYLVTFTSRYDGSSKFSKNQKWAFFPSGSFAWNMHREGFMKNLQVISQFKWRASYGIVGNQAINSYQTLARLSPVLSVVNGAQVNAVRPTAVANDMQ
jgi:TonB-linked SusC/RagA family outer membrane protein